MRTLIAAAFLLSPVPTLGDVAIRPDVGGLTVLVVGDSWADSMAKGMMKAASAAPDRRITVINGGHGGCGIMQPTGVLAAGGASVRKPQCDTWPERWTDLVRDHRPDAVVFVDRWDASHPQYLPGHDEPLTIMDQRFRTRLHSQLDRAVAILAMSGGPVFLATMAEGPNPAVHPYASLLNDAVRAAADRDPAARLLDLGGQLCTPDGDCPPTISGVDVYDETGHPSEGAGHRLGAWILNSVSRTGR